MYVYICIYSKIGGIDRNNNGYMSQFLRDLFPSQKFVIKQSRRLLSILF